MSIFQRDFPTYSTEVEVFNGKLLRRNSPFLPYSIRIEIIEYLETTVHRTTDYSFFGYFKSDKSRKIFQVFRCLKYKIKEDTILSTGLPKLPTFSTRNIHFLFGHVGMSALCEKDFSVFKNLRTIVITSFCGLSKIMLNAITKVPRLTKLKLSEGKESFGLQGLEFLIEKHERSLNGLTLRTTDVYRTDELDLVDHLVIVSFRGKKPIDFIEKNLHLIRGVISLFQYTVKIGNFSSNSDSYFLNNKKIILSHCTIERDFLKFLAVVTKKSKNLFLLEIHKSTILSLEDLMNEKNILQIVNRKKGKFFINHCFTSRSAQSENVEMQEKIPSFSICVFHEERFKTFEEYGIEITFYSQEKYQYGGIKPIAFNRPSLFLDLLNSFEKLICIKFNGSVSFDDLLMIKNDNLRTICFEKESYFPPFCLEHKGKMKELKENNLKLGSISYSESDVIYLGRD